MSINKSNNKLDSELHLPRVKLSPNIHRGGTAIIDVEENTSATNGKHKKAYSEIVSNAREVFKSGKTQNMKFRENQLRNILKMIEETEEDMMAAFHKDLKKPKFEAALCETEFTKNEVKYILNNFKNWVKPDRPSKRFILNFYDQLYIYKDPYGVILVIGAWNYPVHLVLVPLAGAIAAGNSVVIKPSNMAQATAEYLAKYIPKYLDNDAYPVILGGAHETSELLKQKFDYIFFTGSPTVGKIIHQAAAKSLTPITLELGGKCPVYLDDSVEFETAVERILWGKILNAGQTCVAPDYVLCTSSLQQRFVTVAEKIIKEWLTKDVKSSPDFCRIINDRSFNRIVNLLKNAKVGLGGNYDAKDLFIEPTILIDVQSTDPVMKEEIFGPILALVTIETVQDAIKFINEREKPLALYIFSKESKAVDLILKNTSSGNVLINDTIMHTTLQTLPFGGVGNSGTGCYHGKNTFNTFVHRKGVLKKGFHFIPEKIQSLRYPPYTEKHLKILNTALAIRKNPFKFLGHPVLLYIYAFLIGVIITLIIVYSNKS